VPGILASSAGVLPTLDEALRTDLLVTWLAAAGALGYLRHIAAHRTRSALESRAMLLLGALGALSLARGLLWLAPQSRTLFALTFVPATLIPLAAALFAEGLLRRHLPRWLKLLAAGTTLGFLPLAFLSAPARHALEAVYFPAALALVLACLAGVLLRRDRASLSASENDLVTASLWLVVLGIPLAVSDFRLVLGAPANRLGGLGVLLFAYVLATMTQRRAGTRRLGRDLAWVGVKAAGATLALLLLTGWSTPARALHAASVAVALVLAYALAERLGVRTGDAGGRELLRWLSDATVTTRAGYRAALARYPLTEEHLVLGAAELPGYDADAIRRAFQTAGATAGAAPGAAAAPLPTGVASAAALRAALDAARGAGDRPTEDAAEQLLDVLARYDMTHAGLLAAEPLELLLVALPEVAAADDAELELRVLQRCGTLAAHLDPAPTRVTADVR
jgi:hypothetical protein